MRETKIEKKLRRYKFVIPLATSAVAILLFAGIAFCVREFNSGYYWTVVPAAFLAHAFFIVVVHDGAHRSITRSAFDSVIMNIGAGVMLLPFYAEPFRRYHLIHHVTVNTEIDPLWSKAKSNLYNEKRWLYFLCQLVPILFNAYIIFSAKDNGQTNEESVRKVAIRWQYVLFSCSISALIIYVAKPPIYFVIGTLLILNFISSVRHWCEHMGIEDDKESNTFSFPLGMGIGNHDVHHDHPNYSWLTLSIGLLFKKKDTNPLKTLKLILTNNSYKHYQYTKK